MKGLESCISPLTSYLDSQPPTGPMLSLHQIEARPPTPSHLVHSEKTPFIKWLTHPISRVCLRIINSSAHSDAWSLCIRIFARPIINNEDKRIGVHQKVSIKINWNTEKATWCQKFRSIEKFISTHSERNCPFQRTLTRTLHSTALSLRLNSTS